MLETVKQRKLLEATKEFKSFLTEEEYNKILLILANAAERALKHQCCIDD